MTPYIPRHFWVRVEHHPFVELNGSVVFVCSSCGAEVWQGSNWDEKKGGVSESMVYIPPEERK